MKKNYYISNEIKNKEILTAIAVIVAAYITKKC